MGHQYVQDEVGLDNAEMSVFGFLRDYTYYG